MNQPATPPLAQAPAPVPAHVPRHLVREGDLWAHFADGGLDAYDRMSALHDEMPPIFYIPSVGYLPGAWVPRRQDDMRAILQDTAAFTSAGMTPYARMIGETWRMTPLEVDPPDHAKYRKLVDPLFTPKRIEELTPGIRAHAQSLVDALVAKGHCDFSEEFAEKFPTLVFLRLMGWPEEMVATFVDWTHTIVKSQDMQLVAATVMQVRDYLRERIAEGRVSPRDDFIGYLMRSQVEGRALDDEELFGYAFLVFLAGLDTVASSLSLHFAHLARHPEQQAELREHPERIPAAVEELLRAYSTVSTPRVVTRETTVGGVTMMPGDMVLLSTALGSRDPEKFKCPAHVDFNRADAHVPHQAFGFGPHRCAGSHLARRELRIALEVWTATVPTFRIGNHPVQFRGAGVFSLDGLHLEWDAAAGGARA